MNPKTFIFFGPAGSGKGTQSEQLTKYFQSKDPGKKIVYIETGQKLREFIKAGGYTRDLIKDVMAKGGLLPAFVPIFIWTSTFIDELDSSSHIILDGLCRRVPEAPILDEAMQFYGRVKPVIIILNVSDEECINRSLNRKRYDDKVEKIQERLNWYRKDVLSAVEYFRNNDYYKVVDINGEQSVEKVHADIVATMQ